MREAYSMADVHPKCRAVFTSTHELGHSMGSQHAREDPVNRSVFPYSFGYKWPGRFRTVMAYECQADCPAILAFSSSHMRYTGLPAGTRDDDNALSIENTAYTVANFRPSVLRYKLTWLPGQSGYRPTSINSAGDLAGLVTLPWYSESPGFSTTGGASSVHSVGSAIPAGFGLTTAVIALNRTSTQVTE